MISLGLIKPIAKSVNKSDINRNTMNFFMG